MPILYCAKCGTGYGSVGEVPLKCPACDRVTSWKSDPFWPARYVDEPKVPWELTYNDCKFLRMLKIDPEATPPADEPAGEPEEVG